VEQEKRDSDVPQAVEPIAVPHTATDQKLPTPPKPQLPPSPRGKSGLSRFNPLSRFTRGGDVDESIDSDPDIAQSDSDTHVIPEQKNEFESVSSSFVSEELTADGQIVIDHSSSLNAKPWYTPKWKKLPRRGPSRDLEIDLGSVADLRVIAGSTRGTKHQYYGDENQDAFHIAQTADAKYLVVAVADGVGSADFSAYGSRFVSYFVAEEVATRLNESENHDTDKVQQIIRDTVMQASDKMQQWQPGEMYAPSVEPTADNKNIVSSTLCIAVIPVEANSDGDRVVTIGCVGDSPCYTLNGAMWTLQSVATKEGAILEHGTYALPSALGQPPLMDLINFTMKLSDVLVLMTDGIGTSLASGDTAVGRWLGPRLYGPHLMTDMVHTLDFVQTLTADRQGEDDDRTLAVVYDFNGVQQAIQAATEAAQTPSETLPVASDTSGAE
jgi:serine/threonine protein phosphatase PrpC